MNSTSLTLTPITARHQTTTHWAGKDRIDPYERLWWITAGEGRLELHGKSLALQAGHFVYIPSGTAFTYNSPKSITMIWCHFEAHLPGGLGLLTYYRPRPPQRLGQESNEYRWMDECASRSSLSPLAWHGRLALLLNSVLIPSDESNAEITRLEPVLTYIEEHLAAPLHLEQLAGLIHLEANYFSARFKSALGLPPTRYIARRRIERAQRLLRTTGQPLAAIAEQTGFCDAYHFSRVFKSITGQRPGAYRRLPDSP